MDRINSNREKVATSICFISPEPIGSQGELFFYLNTVYLTSITQRAQRTYRRSLEGANVCVLWSHVMEETGEPEENKGTSTGNHYPATGRHEDSILGGGGGK